MNPFDINTNIISMKNPSKKSSSTKATFTPLDSSQWRSIKKNTFIKYVLIGTDKPKGGFVGNIENDTITLYIYKGSKPVNWIISMNKIRQISIRDKKAPNISLTQNMSNIHNIHNAHNDFKDREISMLRSEINILKDATRKSFNNNKILYQQLQSTNFNLRQLSRQFSELYTIVRGRLSGNPHKNRKEHLY